MRDRGERSHVGGRRPTKADNGAFRRSARWSKLAAVSWIWCNGDFLDGPLAVSPADRGLTNGLGLFETVLALDGKPVALDLHLARMAAGAARLRWSFEEKGIQAAITGLLERCGLVSQRARVRIAMTAGAGDLRDMARGADALTWIVAAASLSPPESVTLATSAFPRNERSPLAGLKCASYAENLLALDEARRAGADEPLFFNTRGELCETATANVFLVKNGEIFTPPLSSGCLPGTMRQRVMQQVKVKEAVLTEAEVASADEVFLTSAIRGVTSVSQIDERRSSAGRVASSLRG
jgi:branched-chain amino acid aminotransferase